MAWTTRSPLVFLILGSVFMLLALWQGGQRAAWLMGTSQTTGTVVAVQVPENIGADPYRVIVRFTTSREEVQFETTTPASALKVGDQVPVAYPPADPQAALLGTFQNLWLPTLHLLDAGALLVLSGMLIRWLHRRRIKVSAAQRMHQQGWLLLIAVFGGMGVILVLALIQSRSPGN